MNKIHYSVLDGLRGIAAIAVMIHHILQVLFAYVSTRDPVSHIWLSVDFFFCLSGFVVAYAYDDRMKTIGLGRFFLKRLIRLHPLVIIGSIIGMIAYTVDPFVGAPLATGLKTVIFTFFLSLLMIPTPYLLYRDNNLFPYNAGTWSLFFGYILNVIYALALSRISRRWLLLVGVLSAAFLIYIVRDSSWFHGGWNTSNYMIGLARIGYSFTAGLLIFRYNLIFQHRLGFLLPCLLLIGVFLSPHRYGDWKMELYYAMIILPVIVCLGAGAGASGLTERLCRFLGRISYSLYMTHIPSVFLFRHYCAKINPTDGVLSLYLLIVTASLIIFNLLFAYAILRWVDEPLRKWLNELICQKKEKHLK